MYVEHESSSSHKRGHSFQKMNAHNDIRSRKILFIGQAMMKRPYPFI
jgi:hypothetical protein